MGKLEAVLDKIETFCEPVSIFLYGSRARTDFLEKSGYEIGVLIQKNKYVGRSEIANIVSEKNFSIYPFVYEDFVKGKVSTPFQKSVYLRELILAGKTLRGEKIIENLKPPAIMTIDLIQEIRFNIGFALASIMSYQQGDIKTASLEFYKSCLFGTRDLIMLKSKRFIFSYDDVFELSQKIDLAEYGSLVSDAYLIREKGSDCDGNDLFQNISFLNKFIEPQIIKSFKKNGNQILIQ